MSTEVCRRHESDPLRVTSSPKSRRSPRNGNKLPKISCSFFSRKPPKRRRLNILHPETTEATIDRLSMYDNSMITFPLQTSRIDYDALVLDFLRACVVGNMVTNFCLSFSFRVQKADRQTNKWRSDRWINLK